MASTLSGMSPMTICCARSIGSSTWPRFVRTLVPYYSDVGRPSIDPELMIRMLIVGYCLSVRSERRLCDEVHLNLAYRWFCRLGLDGDVPDHSTFSKNRHGRFARAIFCVSCSRRWWRAA